MIDHRRRSVLFVPGDKPRALEKARTLRADALILDLEDAVAPERKADARANVAAFLGAPPAGVEVVVRVPDVSDVVALGPHPCAVLLPKVDGPEAVAQARSEAGGRAIWAMIETAAGVLRLAEIAAVMAPGEALVLGPNDLALDLDLRPTSGRPELAPILSQVVVAARAYGLSPLDGVFNDLTDAKGLAAECRQARAFGFSGKTLIHPDQIAVTNAAFSASVEELVEAQAIVAAFADPANAGKGVVSVGGRMAERLHLARALRTLASRD